MSLSAMPSGIQVFVDANILAYYFLQSQPLFDACDAFFERVEAIARFGLNPRAAVLHLTAHPEMVKQLQHFRSIPGDLARARIRILDVTYRELHASKQYREEYGLLTRDSIILAVMRRQKLTHLVTNDRDFESIPAIKVWAP
ncbi:MAG: type II toxin-antitoxin system VapC family toxin [Anaerolineae bacterium]